MKKNQKNFIYLKIIYNFAPNEIKSVKDLALILPLFALSNFNKTYLNHPPN